MCRGGGLAAALRQDVVAFEVLVVFCLVCQPSEKPKIPKTFLASPTRHFRLLIVVETNVEFM